MNKDNLPYNIPKSQGTLFMISNHIGDLGDLSQRALPLLREADLLVFEEDRPAKSLLKYAGIHRPYLKFNEHKQKEVLNEIKVFLKNGKRVVYMSDQGTPNIADPGREVLATAYEVGAKIRVIPGPSSITGAISACPLDMNSFFYRGFLHRETIKRKEELKKLLLSTTPTIILDTPYRLKALISDIRECAQKKRKFFFAFSIGQEDEAYFWLPCEELGILEDREKSNFVLIF